jgi:hypothetical protein
VEEEAEDHVLHVVKKVVQEDQVEEVMLLEQGEQEILRQLVLHKEIQEEQVILEFLDQDQEVEVEELLQLELQEDQEHHLLQGVQEEQDHQ